MGGRLGKTDTNKLGRGCESRSLARSSNGRGTNRGKTCSCANGKFVCVTRIVSGTIIIQHLPPRPSYFLTRQTTRRSFISFFSPLLSFDQRPISFYTRIYLSNPWNLSNDYEPKRETSISIRESVYGFAKERRRDDPISVEEG